MAVDEHKRAGARAVPCAVVTVSDTRTEADDASGGVVCEALEAGGHRVVAYEIVADDPGHVADVVRALAANEHCAAVVLNGGTGIGTRDNTYEAVSGVLTKRLDGFGELFRALSYREIGPAAMLSRAIAGLVGNTAVFSVPGSPAACRLAMRELIVPELGHLVALADPAFASRPRNVDRADGEAGEEDV